MTDCEKRELIKSMAMGMSFEDISVIYEMNISEIEEFYKAHKNDVDEERAYQRGKED